MASSIACAQPRNFNPPTQQKLEYIENQGQWNEDFLYKASLQNGTVFLQHDAIVFDFYSAEDARRRHDNSLQGNDTTNVTHHAWKVEFVNCNAVNPIGEKPFSHYLNFFLGNDPSSWRSRIFPCERVVYENLWDGIDMIVYSSNGNFKYEFIVHPGAAVQNIRLGYKGIEPQLLNGSMEMHTVVGSFSEARPYCFQLMDALLTEIPARYKIQNGELQFQFQDGYDIYSSLIIDPELIAATLVGVPNGQAYGYCATFSPDGTMAVGSRPFQNNLPITLGVFQDTFSGGQDIGISCFNGTGTELQWCTYLGGSATENLSSLLVNNENVLLILGSTKSANFPLAAQSFDPNLNGLGDIFLCALSNDGSALMASTYFGGTGLDGTQGAFNFFPFGFAEYGQYRGDLACDNQGNIIVAISSMYLDYPGITSIGSVFGNSNYTVMCFSADLSQLYWCTQVGTTEHERVFDMELLANGNRAVCGSALGNLLTASADAYQNTAAGNSDGWIGIFNPVNGALLRSTFFGTASEDEIHFIDEDTQGNLWVCGVSNGDIPQVGNGYSNPGSFDFIAKFDAELTELQLCSAIGSGLGTTGLFAPSAFMLDDCNRIYISGHGNYNALENLPITTDAIYTEGGFYLAVFETGMQDLVYGTYFGGDHIDGGSSRFDPKGVVYQGVCSLLNPVSDQPFIAQPDAYANTQTAGAEAAVFKIDFESPAVVASFTYEPLSVCVPYQVAFSNWSDSATFNWNVGVGGWINSQDSTFVHTFTEPGDYLVQLAAFDMNSCNVHDTMKVVVHVPDLESDLVSSWDITPDDLCQQSAFVFAEFTGSGADSLVWQTNGELFSDVEEWNFYYAQPGNYILQVVAYDFECATTDTLETIIQLGLPVSASVEILQEANGCVPQQLIAQSTSLNSDSVMWVINDEVTSSNELLEFEFSSSGIFEVELIATSSEGCLNSDTTAFTIEVFALPNLQLSLPDTLCKEAGAFLLDGGTPEGGTWTGEGVEDGIFNAAAVEPGVYEIQYNYTDSNGCSATTTEEVTVAICHAVVEFSGDPILLVYPNPASEEVVFESSQFPIIELRVFHSQGQLVVTALNTPPSFIMKLDVRTLAAGSYHYEALFNERKKDEGSFVVE